MQIGNSKSWVKGVLYRVSVLKATCFSKCVNGLLKQWLGSLAPSSLFPLLCWERAWGVTACAAAANTVFITSQGILISGSTLFSVLSLSYLLWLSVEQYWILCVSQHVKMSKHFHIENSRCLGWGGICLMCSRPWVLVPELPKMK